MLWSKIIVMAGISILLRLLFMVAETGHAASIDTAVSSGRRYFNQHCSSCHGPDGRGNGLERRGMQTSPSDLTQIARRHGGYFPEQHIISYIDGRTSIRGYHQGQKMPVWGRRLPEMSAGSARQIRTKEIISALVQYLKAIQVRVDE